MIYIASATIVDEFEAKRESISYITKRPIAISSEEMKKEFANSVAEHCTVRPNATTNNSHMLPHEIAATHETKARIIGNVRYVDKSLKRKYQNNYRNKKKAEKRAEEEDKRAKKRAEEEDKREAKREAKREKERLRKRKYRQALINKKRDCIKPYS